jgi:hypothetical protein
MSADRYGYMERLMVSVIQALMPSWKRCDLVCTTPCRDWNLIGKQTQDTKCTYLSQLGSSFQLSLEIIHSHVVVLEKGAIGSSATTFQFRFRGHVIGGCYNVLMTRNVGRTVKALEVSVMVEIEEGFVPRRRWVEGRRGHGEVIAYWKTSSQSDGFVTLWPGTSDAGKIEDPWHLLPSEVVVVDLDCDWVVIGSASHTSTRLPHGRTCLMDRSSPPSLSSHRRISIPKMSIAATARVSLEFGRSKL